MKHLRRLGTTIVVAVFSAGLVTAASAPANAEDGASSAKRNAPVYTTFRKDSSWG